MVKVKATGRPEQKSVDFNREYQSGDLIGQNLPRNRPIGSSGCVHDRLEIEKFTHNPLKQRKQQNMASHVFFCYVDRQCCVNTLFT